MTVLQVGHLVRGVPWVKWIATSLEQPGHLYFVPIGRLREGIEATQPAAEPTSDPPGPHARPIAAPEAIAGTVSSHLYESIILVMYWIHSIVS